MVDKANFGTHIHEFKSEISGNVIAYACIFCPHIEYYQISNVVERMEAYLEKSNQDSKHSTWNGGRVSGKQST